MEKYVYDGNLVFVNILITIVCVCKYRQSYNNVYWNKASNYTFIGLMMILYSVFAFAEADTYHYHEIYDEMLITKHPIHVEYFYYYLIEILPENYYLWRLAIWGTSVVLLIKCFKLLNIDSSIVGLLAPIVLFSQFSLTRGALGFCLMLYALVYIMNNRYSIYKIAIGLCLIYISIFLHRTILVFICLIPIAVLLPLNRKILITSLILFPFLYLGINRYVDYLILTANVSDDLIHHAELYTTEMEKVTANWKGMIQIVIVWSSILLAIIQLCSYYIKNNNSHIIILLKCSYIFVYLAALFYGQNYSNFLYSRFIHAALFPLIVCLGDYFYEKKSRTKLDYLVLLLFTINTFYNLFYFAWKWR